MAVTVTTPQPHVQKRTIIVTMILVIFYHTPPSPPPSPRERGREGGREGGRQKDRESVCVQERETGGPHHHQCTYNGDTRARIPSRVKTGRMPRKHDQMPFNQINIAQCHPPSSPLRPLPPPPTPSPPPLPVLPPLSSSKHPWYLPKRSRKKDICFSVAQSLTSNPSTNHRTELCKVTSMRQL